MASAEAAIPNTNMALQSVIETAQSGVDSFREEVRAEFGSLSSFLVAAETGADNIPEGFQAATETNDSFGEAAKPRKSVESHRFLAGLTAASIALTGALAPSVVASTRIYSGESRSIAQAQLKRMQKRSKAGVSVGGHNRGTDGHGDVLTQEPVVINGEHRTLYTLTLKHFKTIVGGQALVNSIDDKMYFTRLHRSLSKKDTYTYISESNGAPPSIGMGVYLR